MVKNHTQRQVWPLPLATGRWSLSPWNVLPENYVLVYFGHRVPVLPSEGAEDVKGQLLRQSTMKPSKISWHQSLVELSWWQYSLQTVKHCCQERNSVHGSMEREQLELHARTRTYGPLPLANFNLYPFTVISRNWA